MSDRDRNDVLRELTTKVRRAAGAAPVAGDVLTYQTDGLATFAVASGGWPPTVSDPKSILYLPIGAVPSASDNAEQACNVANEVVFVLCYVPFRLDVTRIGFRVGTAHAGKTADFGLYDTDGNRLLHTGAISVGTTGVKAVNIASITVTPGWYYCCTTDTSAGTARYTGYSVGNAVTLSVGTAVTTRIIGTAANVASGGVLPATLGALTNAVRDMCMFVLVPG